MKIGVTGTYCSGKNYIAALLEKRGFLVLDLDALGHSAIETKKTAIFARFTDELKKPDGSVDRRMLGKMVFGKDSEISALEAIVHPEVNRLTGEWINAHSQKDCAIHAALLHKSAFYNQLDCIIIVQASIFTRLMRAKQRDRLSWLEIIRRFKSQKRFSTQYLSKNADIYKVKNSGIGKSLGLAAIFKKTAKLDNQINTILSKVEQK